MTPANSIVIRVDIFFLNLFPSLPQAHCRAVISDTYRQEIVRLTANSSPNVKIVMDQLVTLYLYYWALERTGDLLLVRSCYFTQM